MTVFQMDRQVRMAGKKIAGLPYGCDRYSAGTDGGDEGKAQELTEDAFGKTAVADVQMALVGQVMDTLDTFLGKGNLMRVAVKERREHGRQKYGQQQKGTDASSFFHKTLQRYYFSAKMLKFA